MDIGRIDAAADRLAGVARQTPLLSSPFLDDLAGKRILVKAECLQVTGSFKYRGGPQCRPETAMKVAGYGGRGP